LWHVNLSNADLRKKLKQELNADAEHVDFLPFKDLEQSVRDDVATIKNSPFIPKNIEVSGFIYDVRSGRLLPVT
jgi:carbonic anhydrase